MKGIQHLYQLVQPLGARSVKDLSRKITVCRIFHENEESAKKGLECTFALTLGQWTAVLFNMT